MDFPSPLPFNKLGEAEGANDRPSESGEVLNLFDLELPEGLVDPIDSAELRLFCSGIGEGAYRKPLTSVVVLLPSLGGWGKAAILIDRRTSLLGEPASCSGLIDEALSVGTSGVEFILRVSGERGGLTSLDGVRRASFDGV